MPESNLEEVVDGELLTMPPATKHHGSLIRELQRQFDRQMNSDLDLTQGVGFLLERSPLRYRIPDLAIISRVAWNTDLRTTADPYAHIVPELVVEVVSPANRKTDLKRLLQNYADFQILEVLFVFPESRLYQSYQGLTLIESAQSGLVSPITMPEVSLDLNRLWESFSPLPPVS